MQQIQDILSQIRPTAIRPIFRIEFSTKETEQLLAKCLAVEVNNRGREFLLDAMTQTNVSNVARWLTSERKKRGLMLYGQVGTGKTIMVEAIRTLIRTIYWSGLASQSQTLTVISAVELSKHYNVDKDIVNDNNNKYVQCKRSSWLAIDDLGTEPMTIKSYGNELTPIVDIIYHRYDNQMMTIITTNDNDETIQEKYGVRIADRFSEMFNRISYVGNSYRK